MTAPRKIGSSITGANTTDEMTSDAVAVRSGANSACPTSRLLRYGTSNAADHADRDPGRECGAQPDQRSPAEVLPPEADPEVGEDVAGPPSPAGEPQPQHRRPVADDDRDRHVDERRSSPGRRAGRSSRARRAASEQDDHRAEHHPAAGAPGCSSGGARRSQHEGRTSCTGSIGARRSSAPTRRRTGRGTSRRAAPRGGANDCWSGVSTCVA